MEDKETRAEKKGAKMEKEHLFSKENVNMGHQPEFDYYRTFITIFIIIFHVYSYFNVGYFGYLVYSIIQTLGAPGCQIQTGIGMKYSHHHEVSNYVSRGIVLFTMGQYINLLRNGLPSLVGWWITGEKLFISTVHKAKGLEFENVVVMRAVSGRYPHFAHTEEKEQEEDKRMFYVAISRAMKKLIVSTGDYTITPFLSSIINHFCIRFELFRYMQTVVFAEITAESLRIGRERSCVRETYDFSPTRRIVLVLGCGSLLGLRRVLLNDYAQPECLEMLTSKLNGQGVVVKRLV